ncbi:MAG: hypothetical protein KKE89_04015 [Actinobacteria bacterium]|nr:hypothetical protein [Actinomycetota bacterium]
MGLLMGVLPASADQSDTEKPSTVLGVDPEEIPGLVLPDSSPLLGDEFRIATGDAGAPLVAADSGRKRYLAVWGDGWEILARLVSAGGDPISPVRNVSEAGAPDWGAWPKVVFNPTAREYLVVWHDTRESDRHTTVFGRRVSAKGKPLGKPFRISGNRAIDSTKWLPAVTFNSTANEYLVVWEDFRNGEWEDIFAQRISVTGQRIGSERRITRGKMGSVYKPDVTYNRARNEYLIVWNDFTAATDRATFSRTIYGQRVAATGTRIGPYFPISAGGDWDAGAKVTYNSKNHQYLVAFSADRPTTGFGMDVLGQLVSGTGSLIGSEVMISDTPNGGGSSGEPTIAYNRNANQYLVQYDKVFFTDPNKYATMGQILSRSGSPVGPSFRISFSVVWDPGSRSGGAAWSRKANRYIATWCETPGVFGRLIAG